MNPISRDIITRKKRLILRELQLLDSLRQTKIFTDSPLEQQHVLCHSMQNVISAIIDISQHIITESGHEPTSYYESILALVDAGILSAEFAVEYAKIAKLRNVLVHLYDDIDIEYLFSLMPKLADQTRQFLLAIKDI